MNTDGSTRQSSQYPDIAQTRQELIRFLAQQRNGGTSSDASETHAKAIAGDTTNNAQNTGRGESNSGFDWKSLIDAGLSTWWQDHPLRAGALLLRSATEDYARRRPLQVVTIAAVTGAAVVLFRPWRLISISALMLSLWRASNFAGVAASMMDTAAQSIQKENK